MLWVLALWTVGLYRLNARWNVWTEVRDIARATLLVIALTLSTLFLFKQNDVSRLYLIILFIAEPTVTLIGRLGFRAVFEAARQRGHNARYMVIAGTGTLAQDFADQLEQHPGLGIKVIGHLRAPGERKSVVSRPVLGTIDDIEEIFHEQVVDELAVCLPASAWDYLEPLTQLAASEGKTVRIAVEPAHELPSGDAEEVFDRFLVRSIVNDGHREAGLIFKRLFDIAGAALGPDHPQPDPARDRGRHPHRRPEARPVRADPHRPPWTAVPHVQVPLDGHGCRGAAARGEAPQRAEPRRLQGHRRPAHHAASAAGCAAPRSTSCRSCGTCSPAR